MYNPMKRSVHPFYSVLLLLAMAGSFTIRALLAQNGIFQLKHQDPPARTPQKNALNETLLRYAAVDIGEPRLKQEIDDLLEGNFQTRGRQRSFLSAGNRRADIRLRSFRGILRSPEFNHLWKSFKMSLSDWSRKRRHTHPDVMSDLAKEVKLLIDEYTGSENGLFKSCAVVGNSGILLKNDYGNLIDSHEAVIRLNNARTKGFEKSVGSKTNISFINSNILHLCSRREGCFCHPYGEVVPIVMYVCQPAHFVDYLLCKSSHRAPLIVTDPRFDVLCAKVVKYYSLRRFVEMTGKGVEEWAPAHDGANFHYSSGMQAVMLALGVCKRVSVFGFGKSELARHHYHTNQKKELSLHDYEAEYDFYRDLVEGIGAVPFVSDKFEFPSVVMYH